MKRTGRGFTLIELLVVIAIIVVLVGMMIPVLTSTLGRSESRGMITRVTNMMTLATSMAAANGQTFRVNFRPADGKFWLTWEKDPVNQPGIYEPYRNSDMTRFQLGTVGKIKFQEIEAKRPEDADEETPYIEFRADGTADRATLVLETTDGDAWTLLISPLTAAIRVVEFDTTEVETTENQT